MQGISQRSEKPKFSSLKIGFFIKTETEEVRNNKRETEADNTWAKERNNWAARISRGIFETCPTRKIPVRDFQADRKKYNQGWVDKMITHLIKYWYCLIHFYIVWLEKITEIELIDNYHLSSLMSLRLSIPGILFPCISSRLAPPPVEMKVNLSF